MSVWRALELSQPYSHYCLLIEHSSRAENMKRFSGLIAVVAASLLVVVVGCDKADSGPWSGLAKLVVERIKQMRLDEEPSGGDLLDRVLPRDCGRHFTKGNRISGGYDAKPGEFPSYVRLDIRQSNGPKLLCGGTLISDRHVLTAAHCIKPNASVTVVTTINQGQPDSPEDLRKVAKICTSNKYNSTGLVEYDLSLIKLDGPVMFNRNIQPACLPKRPSKGRRRLKAVGLGTNFYINWHNSKIPPSTSFPERLQVLPVQWWPCAPLYISHTSVACFTNSHPNYLGSSCPGDSGGPTYGRENGRQVLVGVASQGYRLCTPGLSVHFSTADVYNTRDELVNLMKECQ